MVDDDGIEILQKGKGEGTFFFLIYWGEGTFKNDIQCFNIFLCWEAVLYSLPSTCTLFLFWIFFQGYLYSEQPWTIELTSPSRAKDRFAYWSV